MAADPRHHAIKLNSHLQNIISMLCYSGKGKAQASKQSSYPESDLKFSTPATYNTSGRTPSLLREDDETAEES
jgi:hypothetical protein